MTREEAINVLEQRCGYTRLEYAAALRMAMNALRAQQSPAELDRSRWEGCEYCNDTLKKYRYINACDIGKRCLIYDTPRYCPICGRPITEEAWAELERRIKGGTTDNE